MSGKDEIIRIICNRLEKMEGKIFFANIVNFFQSILIVGTAIALYFMSAKIDYLVDFKTDKSIHVEQTIANDSSSSNNNSNKLSKNKSETHKSLWGK